MPINQYYILRVDHIELISFTIKDLFNLYNYNIQFTESIQFIYGINGIGKTTIFSILSAIFQGNFDKLDDISFKELKLEFDVIFNGEKKKIIVSFIKQDSKIKYVFNENGQINSGSIKENISNFGIYGHFGESFCLIAEEDEEKFQDTIDIASLNTSELLILYMNPQRNFKNKINLSELYFDLFFYVIVCFYNVEMISSERLSIKTKQLKEYQDEIESNIEKKTKEIKNRFMHSQESIPEIINDLTETLSLDKIKKNILTTGLQERIKSLKQINKNFQNNQKMQDEIGFFINTINDYFIDKHVVFQQDQLFIESKNKEIIPIEGLSSGEKQIFILFFDCLFYSDWVYIVLIDEPEISLHVSWQLKFSHTIKQISKKNPRMKYLIASHSPQIIKNQLSLCIKADEL